MGQGYKIDEEDVSWGNRLSVRFCTLRLCGSLMHFTACPLYPHVPDYAQITPHDPVENGCVFSAARKYFRAVCQPEVTGRASRTFARYHIPRY